MTVIRSLAWFLFVGGFVTGQSAVAQKSETTVEGKLVELAKKGRSQILKVEVEGEEREFPLNPRVNFRVLADGDSGFLAANQFIQTVATVSNDKLFARDVTVTVNPDGRRGSAAKVVKAPAQPGRSQSSYVVTGQIASRETTESGYELLQLRMRGTQTMPLYVEKNHKVVVNVTDPDSLEPGLPVTITGRAVGRRFVLSSATINLSEPLKSADVLTKADE